MLEHNTECQREKQL